MVRSKMKIAVSSNRFLWWTNLLNIQCKRFASVLGRTIGIYLIFSGIGSSVRKSLEEILNEKKPVFVC